MNHPLVVFFLSHHTKKCVIAYVMKHFMHFTECHLLRVSCHRDLSITGPFFILALGVSNMEVPSHCSNPTSFQVRCFPCPGRDAQWEKGGLFSGFGFFETGSPVVQPSLDLIFICLHLPAAGIPCANMPFSFLWFFSQLCCMLKMLLAIICFSSYQSASRKSLHSNIWLLFLIEKKIA